MTTAAEGGGPRRRDYSEYRPWYAWVRRHTEWVPGALMWTGHYALWILLAYTAVAIAYNAAGTPPWLGWPVTVLAVAWLVSFGADTGYHESQLCKRCAGATPLDPQAAVDRWRPVLRLFHRKKLYAGTLFAGLAWIFLNGIFLSRHSVWQNIGSTVIVLVIVVIMITSWTHRRLYPWCPWCHWKDGGDEEKVPDPDPEDHGVKPVPA